MEKGEFGLPGSLSICLLCACMRTATGQIIHDQGYVHTIYLSPSDVPYSAAYDSTLQNSVANLQSWYASQLDGKSFSVAPDPVTWFLLPQSTSFYQSAPGGSFDSLRFWNSVLTDATPLVNLSFYDPNDIYVLYVDADPLAGQAIGGVAGVAMLAANDLRGLSGLPLVPINPGDQDIWKNYPSGPDRWIGGLGHELGHALGLDHPGDTYSSTIMQFGYLYYPNTSFADYQKQALLDSPFITADYSTAVPEPLSVGWTTACCLLICIVAKKFLERHEGARQ